MKFEGSYTNNNNSNTNSANTDDDTDQDLRIKYNKNSSFSLKALLEKTKSNNSNKVLNCSNCNSTNCQHIRITRTNRLKMLNHQHHKINIVKPIALRPNQEQIKQSSTYCLNDLNNKFSSIDTINSSNSNSNNNNKLSGMQRRNTIPRVNFKNITLSNYVINSSASNSHQQRPQLNFIKMKLQRYLNENCCSGEVVNSDLFKLKTFDILSLSTLNLNAKHDTLYYQAGQSLSTSSLSSNQNTFQMSSSSSSNESDLDIAQIENDLF